MKVVAALVPFLGMFVVFVVVLRAIVFGDRREREAMKRLEAMDAERLADSVNRGPVKNGRESHVGEPGQQPRQQMRTRPAGHVETP